MDYVFSYRGQGTLPVQNVILWDTACQDANAEQSRWSAVPDDSL